MKKIKVGVVGIGAIAHIFHLPNYRNHPQAELAAVTDLDTERAEKAARDPEVIVIGGGVAEAGEYLFGPLRGRLNDQFPWIQGGLRVVKGELGDEAALIGALPHVYPAG